MIEEKLPSLLKHYNIAHIEGSQLCVGSRASYPFKKEFVKTETAKETAKAIKDMVTQGGGPLEAALLQMVLTARKGGKLKDAAEILSAARPTNTTMKNELSLLLESDENTEDYVQKRLSYYDELYLKIAKVGKDLISDGDGILTTCFPEHTFFLSLALAREEGKDFTVYASETRPYLQGAHLTVPSLLEMGFKAYMITDGMAAHYMQMGKITKYFTAADRAFLDRSVVNKCGTLSSAIAANYFGIPYYPFALALEEREELIMEERDGEEVKYCQNVLITDKSARALYPAFDFIPSSLVKAIVTKDGLYV